MVSKAQTGVSQGGRVQKDYCPSCESYHPVALFRDHAIGRVCVFCIDKHEKEIERRAAEKHKAQSAERTAAELALLEQKALMDKEREKRTAQVLSERRKAINKAREERKQRKAEVNAEKEEEARKSQMVQELAQREVCRRHLLPFIQRFNDSYEAGWVHKDICARLEKFSLDVAEGKSPRLMLFVPPRHGKSEIASRSFPAWHLGKYPEHEFISCSYSADLAMDFSRKVREVIRTPEYGKIFKDTKMDRDSQRIDKWATTANGGYTAAGIGGPITGRGAHVFIIDDPVKNREEADSESVRRSVKNWYTSTAYTRLAPGGGMLIILTRWHDDDLAGWLLHQMQKDEGDQWEVIDYPAIATKDERYRRKGEALHEARYPLEALMRIKRTVGDRDWSALYQQQPVADEGDYFNKGMFKMYSSKDMPSYESLTYYTAWDLAIGQKETNDESFGITVGMDRNRKLWVVDVRHGRWGSEALVDQILDCYSVWKSSITGIERGQIEMAIGPYLEQRIRERGLGTMFVQKLLPGRRDKQARARPVQALMQRGDVMFRSGCDDTTYLINQMLRFPSGVHDDGVDAIAWVGQLIQDMTVSREAPVETRGKKRQSMHSRLRKGLYGGGGGGGHMTA